VKTCENQENLQYLPYMIEIPSLTVELRDNIDRVKAKLQKTKFSNIFKFLVSNRNEPHRFDKMPTRTNTAHNPRNSAHINHNGLTRNWLPNKPSKSHVPCEHTGMCQHWVHATSIGPVMA